MELDAKLDFLLDQMRLALLIQDFTRTQIISKKINVKFFDGTLGMDTRKIQYYEMMIQLALHDKKYIDCAKFYLRLFEIKSLENRYLEVFKLKYFVIYSSLSTYCLS